MSWKLALASLCLPPWTVRRELSRVGAATTSILDRLLDDCASEALEAVRRDELPPRGPLRRRRAALASAHTVRVRRLVEALGRDIAMEEARRALFEVGVKLGEEARHRLGVRRTRRDLLQAARILYRVLGIRFQVEWTARDAARVRITRCALARRYTLETCLALSAADAGVVAGLWPGTTLTFDERITQGKAACLARLVLPDVAEAELR